MSWWRKLEFEQFLPYMNWRNKRGFDLKNAPQPIEREALALVGVCVSCGRKIFPFREREGGTASIYFSPACPQAESARCQRSRQTREALADLRRFKADSPRYFQLEFDF